MFAGVIWLAAALILGIIEVLSVDFVFLMLAFGAAAACVAAFSGAPIFVQVLVFVVVSIMMLLLVRPWLKRILQASIPNIRTNAQALVGEDAVTVTAVTTSDGRARIGGEIWSARLDDIPELRDQILPEGIHTPVLFIDGATAILSFSQHPVQRQDDAKKSLGGPL